MLVGLLATKNMRIMYVGKWNAILQSAKRLLITNSVTVPKSELRNQWVVRMLSTMLKALAGLTLSSISFSTAVFRNLAMKDSFQITICSYVLLQVLQIVILVTVLVT